MKDNINPLDLQLSEMLILMSMTHTINKSQLAEKCNMSLSPILKRTLALRRKGLIKEFKGISKREILLTLTDKGLAVLFHLHKIKHIMESED